MIGRNVPHTASAIATMSARVRLARQVWANRARFTSARPRAGPPRGRGKGPAVDHVVGVELEEGLLEPRRLDGQVVDRQPGDGGQERPDVAFQPAAQPAVGDADIGHAGHAVERRRRPVEPHLDVALAARQQGRDVLERDEPAVPDDRHAIAHALDLGQDVRREEDRPAGPPQVLEDRVEGVLHERVEALGRLVEDRQLRVVLERLDDAELLAHPARVVADLAAERLAARARAGRGAPPGGSAGGRTARRGRRAGARPSARPRTRCHPAGSRRATGSRPNRGPRRGRAPMPGRSSGGGSRGAAGWSCSCPRRWARGTRRSRPPRPRS